MMMDFKMTKADSKESRYVQRKYVYQNVYYSSFVVTLD